MSSRRSRQEVNTMQYISGCVKIWWKSLLTRDNLLLPYAHLIVN